MESPWICLSNSILLLGNGSENINDNEEIKEMFYRLSVSYQNKVGDYFIGIIVQIYSEVTLLY
jgi:hypothetical protein